MSSESVDKRVRIHKCSSRIEGKDPILNKNDSFFTKKDKLSITKPRSNHLW